MALAGHTPSLRAAESQCSMQGQLVSQQRPCYSREEVSQHGTAEDCWIILHGEVYDVTSWLHKHPGGAQLLLNHAGEDASVSGVLNYTS